MSYMKQNTKHNQTIESAQYRLEIIFNPLMPATHFMILL